MAWIDALFNRMVEVGASDLHMTSSVKPQFRLHGDIVPINECAEIQADQMRQILREELGGAASTVAVALGDTAEKLGAVKKAVSAWNLPYVSMCSSKAGRVL